MTELITRQPRRARGAGPDAAAQRGWAPLLVVLSATFMTFLDFFIVNVALPSIQGELHAGPAMIQLVVAGYGIAFAVGMISGGRLGDLYGRRRLFTIGLALFTLTSVACGLAPGATFLVVARVLQGASGALMTPQVLALIGTIYTGPRRGKAFAAYGMAMGIAGVLGQLVGGVAIEADVAGSGWRSIFWINAPVGLVGLLLARRHVPDSRGNPARIDLAGSALVTAGLVAIVLPLVEGQQHDWPVWTWFSLAASPVLLGAFVAHQAARRQGGRAPLIDLALFGNRAFAVGTAISVTFCGLPPAFFFVLALYLQDGRGYSPVYSGVVFTAVGAGFFAAMLRANAMAARLGRQVLAVGSLVVGAGCGLIAWAAGAGSSLDVLPGLAVVGFGIGMVLVPLAATVLAGVDPVHAGAASGVLSTAQQVGGALGVAVVGVVFYAALDGGFVHGFTVSVCVLGALSLASAALVQLMPRHAYGHESR